MVPFFNKVFMITLIAFLSMDADRRDVVSILYFQNTTKHKEYDWLCKGMTDMLISDVSKSYQLQVVERENLEKIIKEQKLSVSGLTDESKVIELGKLLNANKMVSGSFIVLGKNVRFDTKITDIETGQILKSFETSGPVDDVFSLEKSLAEDILTHFNSRIPDNLNVRETNSSEASKTYYEGMSLLDGGNAAEAILKFQKASEIDPLYNKPQQNLEAAYRFLNDFKKAREQRELSALYDKADKLRARGEAKVFKTYAEIIQDYMSIQRTPEEIQQFNTQHQIDMLGNTRAQCLWQAMMAYFQITMIYDRTGNAAMKQKLCEQNIAVAEDSRETFKGDPFLPEILYMELQSFSLLNDYPKLKEYSEAFLKAYPDYRMIESVESLYEKALQNLK